MPEAQQNYSNHTRWYPLFHFLVLPLLLLNLIEHVVRIFLAAGDARWEQVGWTVLSITLLLLALAARLMVLKVQDRVIRLEEKLRYPSVLSPELAAKASDLPINQIIALRFASDEELPGLIGRTLAGEFAGTKEIKQAIKEWRGDYCRA